MAHNFCELVFACLSEVLTPIDQEDVERVGNVVNVFGDETVARSVLIHSIPNELNLWARAAHLSVNETLNFLSTHMCNLSHLIDFF